MDQRHLIRKLRLHHIQTALQIASDILFCQAVAFIMYLDTVALHLFNLLCKILMNRLKYHPTINTKIHSVRIP